MPAPQVKGKSVAVRRDANGMIACGWENVESVEAIGVVPVQHITVGDGRLGRTETRKRLA